MASLATDAEVHRAGPPEPLGFGPLVQRCLRCDRVVREVVRPEDEVPVGTRLVSKRPCPGRMPG